MMKKSMFWIALALFTGLLLGCKKDEKLPDLSVVARYDLLLIEVTGESLSVHGNHFHGLTNLTSLDTLFVQYDAMGRPLTDPHLHLEADAVYHIHLTAVNAIGQIIPQQWVIRGEEAKHALFISGASLLINGKDGEEDGAILQIDPNLTNNAATPHLSYYFRYGAHQEESVDLLLGLYALQDILPASKPSGWWNLENPTQLFPGKMLFQLPIEIHVSEGHSHSNALAQP
jgi:hypothetical protein